MDYTEAKQGRTFVIRFDDGEDLLECLKSLIRKEDIKAGIIYLIGALAKSRAVLGPEERAYPPSPFFWEFDDAREILGLAIVAWEGNEPKIHLHSGIGHFTDSKVGCIREQAEIFLTIEAVIQEFISTKIKRKLNEKFNASLLDFE